MQINVIMQVSAMFVLHSLSSVQKYDRFLLDGNIVHISQVSTLIFLFVVRLKYVFVHAYQSFPTCLSTCFYVCSFCYSIDYYCRIFRQITFIGMCLVAIIRVSIKIDASWTYRFHSLYVDVLM